MECLPTLRQLKVPCHGPYAQTCPSSKSQKWQNITSFFTIYLYLYIYIYISISISIYLYIYIYYPILFLCYILSYPFLSYLIYLCIYPSIYLSIHLSIYDLLPIHRMYQHVIPEVVRFVYFVHTIIISFTSFGDRVNGIRLIVEPWNWVPPKPRALPRSGKSLQNCMLRI